MLFEDSAESYVSEVCRETFRYIYKLDSLFDSCVEDLEKLGNFICLLKVATPVCPS